MDLTPHGPPAVGFLLASLVAIHPAAVPECLDNLLWALGRHVCSVLAETHGLDLAHGIYPVDSPRARRQQRAVLGHAPVIRLPAVPPGSVFTAASGGPCPMPLHLALMETIPGTPAPALLVARVAHHIRNELFLLLSSHACESAAPMTTPAPGTP